MEYESKTRTELINELKDLSQRIDELAFLFFSQVCFANYAINPEVQKSITKYDEKQTDNEQMEHDKTQEKIDKVVKGVLIYWLILAVLILVVLLVTAWEVLNTASE